METIRFNWVKIIAISCILVCITDFILLFVLGSYYPGYSQLKNTISSLGATASPVSEITSLWWIFIGIVFVLFGILFRKTFDEKPKSSKWVSLLIILYGLGEGMGSGLFKADRIAGKMTNSFVIHDIAGGIGIIAALILPLAMQQIITKQNSSRFYFFSWIIFSAGIITAALFLIRFSAVHELLSCRGLWQRLFMLNLYVYLIAISVIMYNKKMFNTQNQAR